MTAMPLSNVQRATDTNGDPASGAKRYVYAAGTTTVSTVFSDSELAVQQANPLTADAGGVFAQGYLADGSYKVVIKDSADVTLYEEDNIDISAGSDWENETAALSARISANDDDIAEIQADVTAIEAKTDYITVTAAVNLDTLNSLASIDRIWKGPAEYTSDTNVTASGAQTVDGQSPKNGDVIGLVGQTDASENGLWVYSDAGAWTRTTDLDEDAEVDGATFYTRLGDANAGKTYVCTVSGITIDTDDMLFVEAGNDDTSTSLDPDMTDGGLATRKDAADRGLEAYRAGADTPLSAGFDFIPSLSLRQRLWAPNAIGETWMWLSYGQSNRGGTVGGASWLLNDADLIEIGSGRGGVQMLADSGGVPGFGDGTYHFGDAAPSSSALGFRSLDQRVNPKVSGELQTRAAPGAVAFLDMWDDDLPRIVVRDAGVNGKDMTGSADSLHLDGVSAKTDTYNRMIQVIQDVYDNVPSWAPLTRVIVDFDGTQESDQNDDQATYSGKLTAFFDDVETDVTAIGASIAVTWLLTGAGGNSSDNDWEPIKAMQSNAAARSNGYFVGPRYPYSTYDGTHMTAQAQSLHGELVAACAHSVLRGYEWDFPTITAARSTTTVTLTATGVHALEVQERWPCGSAVKGFSVTDGGAPLVTAVGTPSLVAITGGATYGLQTEIAVTLASEPSGGSPELHHAYRDRLTFGDDEALGYYYGQGSLRLAGWSRESKFLPGETIYRYMPAQSWSI